MKQRPRSEQGDTLVEILVSVVILGIVAAGLFAGMTTTIASSNVGRQQADAEALLTSVTDAIKDPTQFQYSCTGDYSPGFDRIRPTFPPGWTVTYTPLQWNGTNFGPFAFPCTDQMQDLTIQVVSPGGVTWSRHVIRGVPR